MTFLEPLIESWDIDLATFGMDIVLNQRLVPEHLKKFEFVEREPALPEEPGLRAFLGSLPERRRDGGRNRVSQKAAVHA